ncbi:hypothetical protein SDC9_74924 [bioreactor metagenome]|uniref:Uncharacterized protein n=1 Tax=bioreactor metagenome TaxID=1076179 RepID=A0A644YIE3_9ZZZZ
MYPFPYCHRGDHDDEFIPTVLFIEFKHGLGIDICLAGSCFHLNREVETIQSVAGFQTLLFLYGLYIPQNISISDFQFLIRKNFLHPGQFGAK